jgi:hypothetical protein
MFIARVPRLSRHGAQGTAIHTLLIFVWVQIIGLINSDAFASGFIAAEGNVIGSSL